MAGTTPHLSLEEFHKAYDGVKPNHEYWFGEATPKPMRTVLDSAVQTALILLLFSRGWKVFPEVTLKMVPDAALVPDLIVTRRPLAQPYPESPVELCIEIRSPDDRLKKVLDKGQRYLEWGVRYLWIIDPAACPKALKESGFNGDRPR
jgi:Uma2 family endonuclease